MRRACWVAGIMLALWAAVPAFAEDWPTRPVTIIYPWPPGGGTDTMTRLVAERLSKAFGQTFIVDVRAGASGTIGSEAAARAKPDGYTLVLSGLPSHVIAPIFLGTSFDPMKDFTHIALFGGSPVVLAVHPGLNVKTVADYVAVSRSKADGVAFGSPGTGSFVHLAAERFRQLSGAKLLHVPYKGLPPVALDLVAGHVPSAFMTLSGGGTGNLHRDGKVRMLAIATPSRLPAYPDVPTFVESGYDLSATTWFGLSAPAGLPDSIAARLNAQVRKALAAPEIHSRLLADGISIEPRDLDTEGFTAFFRAEIKRWAPLAKAAKPLAGK